MQKKNWKKMGAEDLPPRKIFQDETLYNVGKALLESRSTIAAITDFFEEEEVLI